ncbi:TPA: hypothetical protein ACP5VM_004765 [Vibrio parahaemolyticus]|uniref:hypothetical protein n=1 Tax=Vibrio parahaemolyticus TaxID=670 RepID=UPI00040B2590|nr:hypothetical protein [Vibrio parahaemolyticus]
MTDFIGQKVARLESSVEHQETLIADLKERTEVIESRCFGCFEFAMGVLVGFWIAVFIFNN